MKRSWVIGAIVVAGMLLGPFIVPVFVPWSGINCEHHDINIKTGQARYSRYLWFVKVSEAVKETPLSAALEGEIVDVADIEPWQRVSTFSPGLRHSPHYTFHDALRQAGQMDVICTLLEPTPEQQRQIAETILTLWQQTGQDTGADKYIQKLIDEEAADDPAEAAP